MGRKNRRKRHDRSRGQVTAPVAKPTASASGDGSTDRRFFVWLFVVLVVSLGTRWLHVLAMDSAPAGHLLLGDAESYHAWAMRLVSGEGAGNEVFYQAPLYPYFLGVLFSFFEPDPTTVRAAQAILGSLACVFLSLAGRSWFSPTAGIIAGMLLAVFAPAIFFVGLVQKTTMALVLFCLLLWLLGTSSKQSRRPFALWAATGACLAVTALTRENALILVIPIGAWIVWGTSASTLAMRLGHAAAFVAGLGFVLGPVALRNYAIGGDLVLTTSQLGPNLYIGNNKDANGSYQPLRAGRDDPRFEASDAHSIAEERTGRSLSRAEVSSFYVGEVVGYITTEPWEWSKLMGRKLLLATNAVELADTEDLRTHAEQSSVLRMTNVVWHFGMLLPLAVVGGLVTWSSSERLVLLHGLGAAYGAGLIAFFIFARYRFLVVPLLILFAAVAIPELWGVLKRRRIAALSPVVAAGALAAILANWPVLDPVAMQGVTHFNYGLGFERQGEEELARASYSRSLTFQRNAEVYYRIGMLEAQDSQIESAVSHLQSAASLSPDFHAVRNSLGALLLEQGDAAGAEAQFREAIRLIPDDPQALNNLANISFQRGDLDDALRLYHNSIEADPTNAQTHNNLGIIAAIRGELSQAIEHFEDALEIDPGYEEARINLSRAQMGT